MSRFVCLFNDAVVADIALSSNHLMINEYWIGRDMKGSDCVPSCIIYGMCLAVLRKTGKRISNFNRCFWRDKYTSEKYYFHIQFAWWSPYNGISSQSDLFIPWYCRSNVLGVMLISELPSVINIEREFMTTLNVAHLLHLCIIIFQLTPQAHWYIYHILEGV
jgi:hypothetical protein